MAPPATAQAAAAAVESTAAAGTETGANMAATALAQQPVADALAAAFHDGIATTPPKYHIPQVVRFVAGSAITPLFIIPLVTTPPTPSCGCAEVLSHPVVYHTPFMAPASGTFSPGLHKIQYPPQVTTPGDKYFKTENLITGVWLL